MKSLFTILLITFSGFSTFATAQYPDKIIYNGRKYNLHSNPLESFFAENPDKRPKGELRSTALWRGYVATFEVRNSQLFLKDIEIEVRDSTKKESYGTKWKSVLHEVFPNKSIIKIDWLKGLLVLPYGKVVNYVHMGYGSTYSRYLLLEFYEGDFRKVKRFSYKEYQSFKEKQFEAFKKTDEYSRIKADLLKDRNSSDELIDSFLRSFVTDYTSKILIE